MREEFYGYVRSDGQVGIRNHVLLLSGTLYANSMCERVAQNCMNCIPIVHPLGRCQVAPDLKQTRRTLEGHGKNPNAGAVIVADHFKEEGCTADQMAHEISKTGKPVEVVNIRRSGGGISATAKMTRLVTELNRKISDQQREKVPVSRLTLGINCGTSDVTSGIASNRAVGWVVDRIVEQGGQVLAGETTEMMGAEPIIREKCRNPEVAEQVMTMIEENEERILAAGVDIRGSQPTGDNMEGGLSTIEEKSLGAIQKWGNQTIQGVTEYAEPPAGDSGLWLMDTPGHGGESITSIAAGGAPVMTFSTGGGHTINHPLMITIRVTGNSESWEKMKETMEVDVTDMMKGTSVEEAGHRLYDDLLETCDGKMTKAESIREFNAFAINRCGPSD